MPNRPPQINFTGKIIMINFTQNDIALLHRNQIEALTVSELKLAAKVFELRGYSKLRKDELVNLVYETSDILRKRFTIEADEANELEKKKNEIKREKLIEKNEGLHPFSKEGIELRREKLITHSKVKLTEKQLGEAVADDLINFANQGNYAPSTVAKDFTTKIRTAIKLDNGNKPEFWSALKSKWDTHVRLYNIDIVSDSEVAKRDLAIAAEKTFTPEQTNQIIQWSLDHIEDKSVYKAGISFSILTGRRMVEIYGDKAQYSITKKDLITITGVAKKKEYKSNKQYHFIPLAEPQLLVDFINNFSKRGYTEVQVKRTIASKISRKFPQYLKDLGIEKFKDCRDFFAGVTLANFTEAGVRRPMKPTQYCMAHDTSETTATYDKYATGTYGDISIYLDYAKNHTV